MPCLTGWFESFVNSEEYQTNILSTTPLCLFESFVNSEEYQTVKIRLKQYHMFESFVNSEEYQTAPLSSANASAV